MKCSFWVTQFLLLLLFPLNLLAASALLKAKNPWIPLPPPGVQVMAGYLKLINSSSEEVKIIGAFSGSFGSVEFHRSIKESRTMRMERLHYLKVAPNETLELSPGDLHLMLFDPRTPLKEHQKIPMIFKTSDGALIKFFLEVKKRDV